MTEGTQTARISELEAQLALTEEMLANFASTFDGIFRVHRDDIVEIHCGTEDTLMAWFDHDDLQIIKEARDFIAAKRENER